MTRAWLRDHDGLSFKSSARMAHAVDLAIWRDRGWITEDLTADCLRLTPAGRERFAMTCGHCRAWHHIGENRGQCRSAERVDDGVEHAGITREYDTCEAWLPIATPVSDTATTGQGGGA